MSASLLPFPRRPVERLRVFKRGGTWFCLSKTFCGVGPSPCGAIRNWMGHAPKAGE